MKKVISFVIALAVMVSMFVVPSMAFGSDYFATYTGVAHNGDNGYVFWFDADAADYCTDDGDNGDAAGISHGDALRGAPYVNYLRNWSTPKGISGDDGDIYWGIETEGNRYIIMNDNTRWTNDNCINNAYTFTIDVSLTDGYNKTETGSFESTPIANVANKFAGVRMYTKSDADAYDASSSSMTPGTSGIGFNVNVADATKDQLIIYVKNADNTATSAAIDLADGTFASWATLKVVDDFAGNMVVCINGKTVANLAISGSSVTISDAAGSTIASTTTANLYSKANFHVVNLNDGFLNIDNVGVKAYSEDDIPATEAPATEEPATEAPATEEPATEAPATEEPATEAPATEEPATEAPATEAPATDAPAEPVTEEIDFTNLPSAGNFTAAGYPEDVLFLNFASGGANDSLNHSIGIIDLSKYHTMTISYATDAAAASIGTLLLKNTAGDVIAEVVIEPCSTGWTQPTTVSMDISAATNNEELFLNLVDAANGMIIAGVTLEGDAPATDAPATDAPATDAPATDAPATDAPATDAPATDAPATDAPATDAPAVDVPVKLTIDISKLPTCGDFKAAGYPETEMLLNFFTGGGNDSGTHSIGVIDLTNYNTMTISYATDASAQTVGKLVLMNAAGDVIAEADVAPCTTGWRQPTTLTIDVSKATNNEELFLSLTNATNGMVVTDITLEGVISGSTDTDAPSVTPDNGNTGDVMSFVIIIAAAAFVVTVLSKKRVY